MSKKQNKNYEFDEEYRIDKSQFEIESELTKENEEQELGEVPIDENNETIHFPWFIAIIMGVLAILIVGCIIAIKLLEM